MRGDGDLDTIQMHQDRKLVMVNDLCAFSVVQFSFTSTLSYTFIPTGSRTPYKGSPRKWVTLYLDQIAGYQAQGTALSYDYPGVIQRSGTVGHLSPSQSLYRLAAAAVARTDMPFIPVSEGFSDAFP